MHVPLFDLILCVSNALDLVSPQVSDHHKRVAYIAAEIAEAMHLPLESRDRLAIAGALHDVGALTLSDRLSALEFETEKAMEHSVAGALLLASFQPFEEISVVVRHHHAHWKDRETAERMGAPISPESYLLHLADRISVLLPDRTEVLNQVPWICRKIREQSGRMFDPVAVEAFLAMARKESFWFNLTSPGMDNLLSEKVKRHTLRLDPDTLEQFGRLVSYIVDFRSPFTAMHSGGVAACAESLSTLFGFDTEKRRRMRLAGSLHDLGKLAVAAEVVDKPAGLNRSERSAMKGHSFYTYRVMEHVQGFEEINRWASLHHERLDGSGYPFHFKKSELPLGSRIMAVADVFTALTEPRPYRRGMDIPKVKTHLHKMARSAVLDEDVVLAIDRHMDELNHIRESAQKNAASTYHKFRARLRDAVSA